MARILICHVPKDGSTARELGAALMGRGHFVSFDGEPDTPRADRSQRLRQFEAVVVIWTEVSAQSAGLEAVAREALPLNLLAPVRAEEVDKTRVPLQFRKLNMFAPRDVDGIARLVARLSTAATSRREMAASPPVHFERKEKPKPPQPAAATVPAPVPQRAVELPPKETPAVFQTAAVIQASEPKLAPATELSGPHERTQPSRPVSSPQVPSFQASSAPAPTYPAASSHAHAAIPPVFESHAAVKARPLFDLPEVAPTFPEPEVSAPSLEEPAKPSRAAELHNALNPQRDQRPAVTAADLSRAVDDGLLVWRIPEAMWLGEPITVEIALNRPHLAGLFPADAATTGHQALRRQSIETLSVSLYGHTDVFEIERQSERTQFVIAKHAQAGRDPATVGRWTWLVTPQAAGVQDLVVRISVLLRDRNGVPEPVALPDRRFEIAIDVPEGADLVSGLAGWHRA
ncbi:hypothetical protein W911_15040 [Hyphomicrobium nitrativorans NL23]|uniref:Uncharacterized protein n=1 Tax=Hyphomicrobium nitrativorans NL23 TaxID=1029756 RepID=V5SJV5_9HYPH|nr:hypothetical protein [Hyphomicrobium nitrativorans]AHB50370.1 hypothetical protein W911_15040 [Hyphomicrobium nitrativorans NL23]